MEKLLIGADPEVFIKSLVTEEIIPVTDLIGGTKQSPLSFAGGFALLEDNVMAEFNIPPADNEQSFVESIKRGIDLVANAIGPLYSTEIKPSFVFPKSAFTRAEHLEFGCDPDYNAYTLKVNKAPNPKKIGGLRACAGHLHFGWETHTPQTVVEKVRQLDLRLGVPSLLMDLDTSRKSIYGKAGAFRYKPYGLEYRTLSNFWLVNDQLISWAYRNGRKAFTQPITLTKEDEKVIRATIDNQDLSKAKELVQTFKLDVL